ncbi:MAG TPA: SMP-30/gluconolactonase/LRE family protein [Burkholderiales bacterium]|nr:SMP-30/gluconolactonase/LRE family protein [Burkholderiales bacterium]
MKRFLVLPLFAFALLAQAKEPRVLAGLVSPESVLAAANGKIYVSQIGEFGKDGDGSVVIVNRGKIEPFATGLNDPKGLAQSGEFIFVTDKDRVWKIDSKGRPTVFADKQAFPIAPQFLNDIVADGDGSFYVSDSGDTQAGSGGAIFKITRTGEVSTLITAKDDGRIKSPNGLLLDRRSLLVVDFASGELHRVQLNPVRLTKLADGFGGGDGLAQTRSGTLFVSDWKGGRVWSVDLKQNPPQPKLYDRAFQAAADIALDRDEKSLLVPDMKAGTLTWLPRER